MVDYLPRIDEEEEDNVEVPVDPAENKEASFPDVEGNLVHDGSTETLLPQVDENMPVKRFRRLRKFFSRLFCCRKNPP